MNRVSTVGLLVALFFQIGITLENVCKVTNCIDIVPSPAF
jgi:hypothetical protein